ncbi:hypothetical protein [Archangium lipolyticum]|uniref:hypothetical protein n=1 Tax=Archangium lipolyticum TaxID=2970465 RepID=UPI00214A3978|nr:hypothetical protein [Archangium lipolyticum]
MKSRLMLLAALATAATGCKKEQPPGPTPSKTSEAAPAATAPAAVKKDPLAEVPRTDSTLSLLDAQNGKCQWLREDPVAQKRAVVASFDGDCKGARMAWSTNLDKALVWFDPRSVQSSGYSSPDASPQGYPDEKPTPGAPQRMYEVTVASGEVRTVPVPSVEGELQELGYKGADLLALSLGSLSEEQQQAQGPITVDGQAITFDSDLEGLPAIAYAYRLDKDGQWKRVEVKGTSQGADLSLGVSALDAASGQGPRSTDMLRSQLDEEGPEPTEAQLAKLLPLVPAPLVEKVKAEGVETYGSWAHGTTPAGSFYVWQVTGEGAYTTGHIVVETGGQLQPLKDVGFRDSDLVSVSTRGPFLLVSAERVGTHPRLYDLRANKLAFRSDTARATTFWPAR